MSASRRQTLMEKIIANLIKAGLPKRKAESVAKSLVPVARNAVKKEIAEKAQKEETKKMAPVEETKTDAMVLGKARKVDGLMLRTDLPVLEGGRNGPNSTGREVDVLRVMHGLTTYATYLVAAVRGDKGIVAIRKLDEDKYNVKFYPTMDYWGVDPEQLGKIGAQSYLERPYYQRMHFSGDGVSSLLRRFHNEAKGKSRIKDWLQRFRAITFAPLQKAFNILYSYKKIAA